MISLRDAIDRVLERVSLAGGADVQAYAEGPIKTIIHHKMLALFDAAWWPQFYNPGETFTLVNGIVTDDLTSKIKRYMDIRHAWLGTETSPLPRLNTRSNPALVTSPCIAPYNEIAKVFRVYPITTAGSIVVAYRTLPFLPENDDDLIDFDDELIVLGAAYDYLNSLGTNPEEEAKLLTFFNLRYASIVGAVEHQEVSLDGDYGGSASGWQEVE